MSSWKPIATAPKDGTFILIGDKDGVTAIACWNGTSWDDGDFHDHIVGITHWMPLPLPPTKEAAG